MIKEVIIVEGKDDISAVKKAVDAEVIATNGYGFPKGTKERIKKAGETKGVIVLTDPDYAGEMIRKKVEKIVPNCKHAYISQKDAYKNSDIGIENASPETIINALNKAHCIYEEKIIIYTNKDLIGYNLNMCENAAKNRALVGEELGIGYSNSKQFLSRLNNYRISKTELESILKKYNLIGEKPDEK